MAARGSKGSAILRYAEPSDRATGRAILSQLGQSVHRSLPVPRSYQHREIQTRIVAPEFLSPNSDKLVLCPGIPEFRLPVDAGGLTEPRTAGGLLRCSVTTRLKRVKNGGMRPLPGLIRFDLHSQPVTLIPRASAQTNEQQV